MFLTVEDCKDLDELVDHVWKTEPDWDIHSFGPATGGQLVKCPLTGLKPRSLTTIELFNHFTYATS